MPRYRPQMVDISNRGLDELRMIGLQRGVASGAYGPTRANPDAGYYRGNAWFSPQQDEDEGEVVDPAQQIETLRNEMVRQSQITQDGSRVFSPDQIRQRQELAESSLAAIDELSPYAASGMVDADTIRKAVGQVASDAFNDQRQLRSAARDFQAIQQGYASGRLTVEQASGAMQQLEQKNGIGTMTRVPGWADAKGLGNQLQQARQERVQAESEKYGVPFVWDDRANKPVRDDEAVTSIMAKGQIDKLNQQVADMPRQQALEVLKIKLSAAAKNIASRQQQGLDTTGAYRQFDKLVNEQFTLASGGGQAAAPAPSAQPNEGGIDDMAAAISTTEASAVESPATPKFTREQAFSAANSGQIPVGKRTIIDGIPAQWTGKTFIRVN